MVKHQVVGFTNMFADPISLLKDSSPEMTEFKASYHLEVPPILGKKVNDSTTSARCRPTVIGTLVWDAMGCMIG